MDIGPKVSDLRFKENSFSILFKSTATAAFSIRPFGILIVHVNSVEIRNDWEARICEKFTSGLSNWCLFKDKNFDFGHRTEHRSRKSTRNRSKNRVKCPGMSFGPISAMADVWSTMVNRSWLSLSLLILIFLSFLDGSFRNDMLGKASETWVFCDYQTSIVIIECCSFEVYCFLRIAS